MHDVVHSFHRTVVGIGGPGSDRPGIDELSQLWARETDQIVRIWRSKVHADLVDHPAQVPGKTEGERGLVRYLDDFTKRNGYLQLEQLFWQLRRFQEYARDAISKEASVLDELPYSNDPKWDLARYGGWQAKAYGSTLLGVLVGPDSLHWVQLGDGAMVQIVGGEPTYLVTPPQEALGNLTPSLCDEDAKAKIRSGTTAIHNGHTPSAILLTTDGVPNSYTDNAGFFKFCRDIAGHAAPTEGFSTNLTRWLAEISRKGSGDDVSVALAWLSELPMSQKPSPKPRKAPVEGPEAPHQIVATPAKPAPEAADEEHEAVWRATHDKDDEYPSRHAVQQPPAAEPAKPVDERPADTIHTGFVVKGGDRGAEHGR
jgi:hypothetical protein